MARTTLKLGCLPHRGSGLCHDEAENRATSTATAAQNADLLQVVQSANADGIDLLRKGQSAMAFEQLKFAEAVLCANTRISKEDLAAVALTCSNLGCYYRKKGLPRAALNYLDRALRVEEANSSTERHDLYALATTKLNVCAALSSVGRHHDAVLQAEEAIEMLAANEAVEGHGNEECSLIAVACHNLGAEREHLRDWSAAALAYRHGAMVAQKVLGPNNPLTQTLVESCEHVLRKAGRYPSHPSSPVPSAQRPQNPRPRSRQLSARSPSFRHGLRSRGVPVPHGGAHGARAASSVASEPFAHIPGDGTDVSGGRTDGALGPETGFDTDLSAFEPLGAARRRASASKGSSGGATFSTDGDGASEVHGSFTGGELRSSMLPELAKTRPHTSRPVSASRPREYGSVWPQHGPSQAWAPYSDMGRGGSRRASAM
mmetsp:Transcript_44222/g.122421  ORF Transcript_44222/g.122421 Transcript_44222/m.122421 type:complete len:431 (+) Transcript_44222:76-1368(+)